MDMTVIVNTLLKLKIIDIFLASGIFFFFFSFFSVDFYSDDVNRMTLHDGHYQALLVYTSSSDSESFTG